jgi:hypothetical protein
LPFSSRTTTKFTVESGICGFFPAQSGATSRMSGNRIFMIEEALMGIPLLQLILKQQKFN